MTIGHCALPIPDPPTPQSIEAAKAAQRMSGCRSGYRPGFSSQMKGWRSRRITGGLIDDGRGCT
jgi:hypothetical protein